MTNFLLCVLIATVAYGIDFLGTAVQSDKKKVERQGVGLVMLAGIVMGGVLYGRLTTNDQTRIPNAVFIEQCPPKASRTMPVMFEKRQ